MFTRQTKYAKKVEKDIVSQYTKEYTFEDLISFVTYLIRIMYDITYYKSVKVERKENGNIVLDVIHNSGVQETFELIKEK